MKKGSVQVAQCWKACNLGSQLVHCSPVTLHERGHPVSSFDGLVLASSQYCGSGSDASPHSWGAYGELKWELSMRWY